MRFSTIATVALSVAAATPDLSFALPARSMADGVSNSNMAGRSGDAWARYATEMSGPLRRSSKTSNNKPATTSSSSSDKSRTRSDSAHEYRIGTVVTAQARQDSGDDEGSGASAWSSIVSSAISDRTSSSNNRRDVDYMYSREDSESGRCASIFSSLEDGAEEAYDDLTGGSASSNSNSRRQLDLLEMLLRRRDSGASIFGDIGNAAQDIEGYFTSGGDDDSN